MAFHYTKKNNGYHSVFIKLFGAVFSGHGVQSSLITYK